MSIQITKNKTLLTFFFLNILIFFFIASSCAYAQNPQERLIYNNETIKLYEDCKSYLLDTTKSGHICPVVIDVAIKSYGLGQMAVLTSIRSDAEQKSVIKGMEYFISEVAKCDPQGDPVLSYNGGEKIGKAISKFVEKVSLSPEILKSEPVGAINYALFSLKCAEK